MKFYVEFEYQIKFAHFPFNGGAFLLRTSPSQCYKIANNFFKCVLPSNQSHILHAIFTLLIG